MTMGTRAAAVAMTAVLGICAGYLARNATAQTASTPPRLLIESVAGRDNFDMYCASCHGRDGRGAGPVASALRNRPADLTTLARRNGGVFPRERVASLVTGTAREIDAHGPSEMPVWGPILRGLDWSDLRVKQRIDNIVAHIASLQGPSTAANTLGSELFRTHCAVCHGPTGRGNGPLAEELRRQPPDLTQYTARNGGIFPSERVARIVDGRDVPSHGDREMPVWGDVFKAGANAATVRARIEAIVKYLEGIQERAARMRSPRGQPAG